MGSHGVAWGRMGSHGVHMKPSRAVGRRAWSGGGRRASHASGHGECETNARSLPIWFVRLFRPPSAKLG
eukprot:2674168-Prymnesium_polylepis.1